MGKEERTDPVMEAVREHYENSDVSIQEIGERMGYAPTSARQSVSQLLKSGDPQKSMLRRFAEAVRISLQTWLK